MKNLSIFLFFLTLGFLTSCNEKTCIDSIVGVYQGTCKSNLDEYQGKVTITKSPKGDYDLLIDDSIMSAIQILKANITPDCGRVKIPSQKFINVNGNEYSISGYYDIDETKLTGRITLIVGTTGEQCTYVMTKV